MGLVEVRQKMQARAQREQNKMPFQLFSTLCRPQKNIGYAHWRDRTADLGMSTEPMLTED